MPALTLTAKSPADLDVAALVVPLIGSSEPSGATLLGHALPEAVRRALTSHIAALRLKGAADEVTRVPAPEGVVAELVVLTGLGEVDGSPTPEQVRRAAGAALRELAGTGGAALVFPDTADLVAATAEGALLGAYGFRRYRPSDPAPVQDVVVATGRAREKAAKAAAARARIVAGAVNQARDLVNTAPADLYPETFADHAVAAAKGTKVKVSVLADAELAEGGYGGLIGVGQGSSRGPRLVRVGWSPARAKGHVALVGKGITFDSGGLSLKPAKSMETMKSDMAGAAAVLHTVLAAAALELPVKVTGWLALAENMPSGTATRPSDVLTIRGGTTVEVLNTDAEGRLVLADALVAACEESPEVVIDIATLTGAQMVALGSRVSAVMGDDGARAAVLAAAESAGEAFWPMPLPSELKSSMKSQVADIANIGDRWGGMLVAGLFLQRFVEETPWAHLDIAGPSFNEGRAYGYTPKGGTGVGVRTLLSVIEQTTS